MNDKAVVIQAIYDAFGGNEYPGDDFLQGSTEGSEPYEEVGPFKGQDDWQAVDPDLLDTHSEALSFFSEAGFRFFLPAYLIADLQDQLTTADPLFHLTHGFSDSALEIPTKTRVFIRQLGRSAFLNPRRYGAITFHEYARFRLSVFTREEVKAIVAYLRYKQDRVILDLEKAQIDAALKSYWLERAATAPSAQSLAQHLIDEEAYLAELELDAESGT